MRTVLVSIFLFAFLFSKGLNDSLVFIIKPQHEKSHEWHENEGGLKIGYDSGKFPSNYYFLYKSDISQAYKEKAFNDSDWAIVYGSESLNLIKVPFTGKATFRLHYRFTDSTRNMPIVCEFYHKGASEIYIDGKLVKKFGKLGTSENNEDVMIPRNEPFYIQHSDTFEHVLSVFYSNFNGVVKERREKGIEFKLFYFEDYQEESHNYSVLHKFLVGLFAFFGALSIVHLFLFFADKSRKFNLFYSMFLLMVALTALWPILLAHTESPALAYFVDKIATVFLPACLFFLINLLYSFFQKKLNFFYYLQAGLFGFFLLCYIFEWKAIGGIAYASMFFSTYFGATIIAIKALRKKYSGSKFLGWGILSFTILFILGVVSAIIFKELILQFILFTGSILGLPLCMTAYLSYDFARTNRSLKEQLAANEDLSRKTIEQEKEKQEILANQNKVLELQVEERTREINEQKNLIEEKQIEILDSIRYAKRIQSSLMPTEKFISRTIVRLLKKEN